MASKFTQLDTAEEYLDIYLKLKDGFDYLASVIHNQEIPVVHQLRAAHALPEMAKTLRMYLLDEAKMQELEKAVKELEQLIATRLNQSQRN